MTIKFNTETNYALTLFVIDFILELKFITMSFILRYHSIHQNEWKTFQKEIECFELLGFKVFFSYIQKAFRELPKTIRFTAVNFRF